MYYVYKKLILRTENVQFFWLKLEMYTYIYIYIYIYEYMYDFNFLKNTSDDRCKVLRQIK